MTKVALCISGQLRDEAISFPSLSKLAIETNATVFVSTWNKRGTKSTGFLDKSNFIRMFGNEILSVFPPEIIRYGFTKTFPDFAEEVKLGASDVTVDDIKVWFPEAIIDVEPESLALEFTVPTVDNNSIRMLYKIWRCNELKRKFELTNKIHFDVVIRVRPDAVPVLSIAALDAMINDNFDGSLWTPCRGVSGEHLGDTIAITSSKNADYYAALFGKAIQLPQQNWISIHHELFHHINNANITVKHVDAEKWLAEDHTTRAPSNRKTLFSLIKDGRYSADASSSRSLYLSLLYPVFEIFETRSEDRQVALDTLFKLASDNKKIVHLFQRELFGMIALIYNEIGSNENYIFCEIIALISEVMIEKEENNRGKDFLRRAEKVREEIYLLRPEILFDHKLLSVMFNRSDVDIRLKFLFDLIEKSEDFMEGLEAIIALDDSLIFLQNRFRYFYNINFDFEMALATAKKLIEKFPTDWIGYDHMGHCSERVGDLAKALFYAGEALKLCPDHGGLHARYGQLSLMAGNLHVALSAYRQAVKLWDHEIPWSAYAKLLIQSADIDELKSVLNLVQSRYPYVAGLILEHLSGLASNNNSSVDFAAIETRNQK